MKFKLFIIIIAICAAYPAYAVQRNMEISWELPTDSDITPDGYRLYIAGQDSPVCSTDQQGATSMTCQLDLEGTSVDLMMTSYIDNGGESPKSGTFTYTFIPTESVHAAFSTNTTSGQAPLLVSFNAETSTGSIASFSWSFGDGNNGTGSTIEHLYTEAGNYTATLTVTDTAGATDSTTISITVSNPDPQNHAPNAILTATPVNGQSPLTVHFDASQSTDPDGDTLSFSWTFGDNSEGTGMTIEHLYSEAGDYKATLTVTDTAGATHSTTTSITVSSPDPENHTPNAVLTATPVNGQSPLVVQFDASHSTDPDGDTLSFTWLFGDDSEGTGVTTSHTYTTPGLYTATLKVTDVHNSSSVTTVPILVDNPSDENEKPVATISVLQHRLIPAGIPFSFSGERSVPSCNTEKIISYEWDMGDGTSSTGEQIIHTYNTPGEYTVTLFIQDSSGKSAQSQLAVRVITRKQLLGILCIQQQIYRLLLKKKPIMVTEQTDNKVN